MLQMPGEMAGWPGAREQRTDISLSDVMQFTLSQTIFETPGMMPPFLKPRLRASRIATLQYNRVIQ